MPSFSSTYDKLEVLGEGAYGVAYLVAQRSKGKGVRYVAKEVRVSHLTEKQREGALAESEVLKMMKHSNIVAHIDTFMEGPRLYIVMEYADGGDLAAKIKDAKEKQDHFEEGEIMFVFVQIALALEHIHAQNVLHRDLKPLNIFLTKQGIVKLGDFGIAKVIENSIGAQTTIGTPHYLSPEMVNSEPYGTKSDLWSLGVVLYEVAALRVPFHGTSLPAVALQIIGADPEPLPDLYSPKLTKIVFGLLEKEPPRRPGLKKVLGSSFVQKYIERNLSHTMNCGSGGLERLSVQAPKSRKEVVAATLVDPGAVIPAAGKSRHQHRDRIGSEEEAQSRVQMREADERARKPAWEHEFHENRRAAAETKMRVEQDIRIANGCGVAGGGPAAVTPVRRQSSGAARYVGGGGDEEREAGMDRGERRKAEVKRQAQERQAQLDAAKCKELDRVRRETAEERLRLKRMQAMQDGGGGMDTGDGGGLQHEEEMQQVRSQSSPTSSPNRHSSPQRAAPARHEEDDDRFGVGRDDRKVAEEAHLRDLERARQENFLEKQRLREKFAAAMAEDTAGNGEQQSFARHGSEAAAPEVALVADMRPSDGSGGGGGGGADEEEDDRRNVEIVIPFSDKVRPKPKLSSDGRAPVSRRRSQSRTEEERSSGGGGVGWGMSGKPSASPGPGVRGGRGGAARLRTSTSRSRASGDEGEEDSRRPPRAPQQAGTASGSSNGSAAGGRQPAGSPARWLPKCAPPEEDTASAGGGGGDGGGRAEWAAEAMAEDGDVQRPRFDVSLLQDALAGALRSDPSSSATQLSPSAAAACPETEEEEGY